MTVKQLEFNFSEPEPSKEPDYEAIAQYLMRQREIPEWYTDSAIRLNYQVMSETAKRAGTDASIQRIRKAGKGRGTDSGYIGWKGVLNEPA